MRGVRRGDCPRAALAGAAGTIPTGDENPRWDLSEPRGGGGDTAGLRGIDGQSGKSDERIQSWRRFEAVRLLEAGSRGLGAIGHPVLGVGCL